jgi:lipoyl(octanoyl) transferase 2
MLKGWRSLGQKLHQTVITRRFVSTGPCFTLSEGRPTSIRLVSPKRVSYQEAASIQENYVRKWLDFKAGKGPKEELEPTIFMFEMPPVYTCGRRERGSLSEQEIEFLRAGGTADFVEASRGGQTTFHGPGQLVAYPIIDLRRYGLPVRCYVSLLETAIINTIARYSLEGTTTKDTGVWMNDKEKIASIGIHVRRNITSHGIALNVTTDPRWFNRIVACGLPDKATTTMALQGVSADLDEVGQIFGEEVSNLLGSKLIKE